MKIYLHRKITVIMVVVVLCGCNYFSFVEADIPFSFDTSRPIALGKAFTAVADDENAILYNPAGLSQIEKNTIGFSGLLQDYTWKYEKSLKNNNYFNIVGGLTYVKKNIGIQVYYKTTGDRINLVELPDSTEKDGLDKEMQIITGFGIDMYSNIKVGLNIRYIYLYNEAYDKAYKKLYDTRNVVLFDISGIYNISKNISVGLIIHNIVSTNPISYFIRNDYGDVFVGNELPPSLDIGMSFWILDNLLLSGDIKNIFEYSVYVLPPYYMLADIPPSYIFKRSYHLGVELGLSENLYLESGFFINEQLKERSLYSDYTKKITISIGSMYKINDSLKINIALSNDSRNVSGVQFPFKYLFSTSYVF